MGADRRIRAVLAAALLVVGLAPLVHSLPAYGAGTLRASLEITSAWGSGSQVLATVTNAGGSPATGWRVEFDLPPGSALGTYWDAQLTSSGGRHYELTNRSWNGELAPGQSTTFGFLVTGSGEPTGCLLDGHPCAGGSDPTPTPTPTATATPTQTPTPTPTDPEPPRASPKVAPYIDITRATPSLVDVARATGVRTFTLAFVLGSSAGCVPAWGGTIPLDDPRIMEQIRQLRAEGGDVVIAFGGAMGPYLETSCRSAGELARAYEKVLDTLGARHLDIDVEATIPTTQVNQALAQVQRERPGTTVSYTLMVQGDDYGLTPALGVDVLKNAVANGVRVDIVNPMAMDFGSARADWGDAVIAAAESVLRQMGEIWPDLTPARRQAMLGVTPMIGRNDNGRVFDQGDAAQLVDWAGQHQIGRLAFWSVGRDNGGCPGGGVSPSCSSIPQTDDEFTTSFAGFR